MVIQPTENVLSYFKLSRALFSKQIKVNGTLPGEVTSHFHFFSFLYGVNS